MVVDRALLFHGSALRRQHFFGVVQTCRKWEQSISHMASSELCGKQTWLTRPTVELVSSQFPLGFLVCQVRESSIRDFHKYIKQRFLVGQGPIRDIVSFLCHWNVGKAVGLVSSGYSIQNYGNCGWRMKSSSKFTSNKCLSCRENVRWKLPTRKWTFLLGKASK